MVMRLYLCSTQPNFALFWGKNSPLGETNLIYYVELLEQRNYTFLKCYSVKYLFLYIERKRERN